MRATSKFFAVGKQQPNCRVLQRKTVHLKMKLKDLKAQIAALPAEADDLDVMTYCRIACGPGCFDLSSIAVYNFSEKDVDHKAIGLTEQIVIIR